VTLGPLCRGCPLEKIGSGYVISDGSGRNGIIGVGEALGKDEVNAGIPFAGGAGKVLNRLFSRVKDPLTKEPLKREDFLITNVLRCRPPDNKLVKEPYERQAIEHCSPYLRQFLKEKKPKTILALGTTALQWFIGPQKEPSKLRGYVWETDYGPMVGTYHPAYIMRGNFHLSRVFEQDVLKALYVSRHGIPRAEKRYITHPSLDDAYRFLHAYKEAGCPLLSFDIETPYDNKDEELTIGLDQEEMREEDRRSYILLRISFSFRPFEAISMPWSPPFIEVAKTLLALEGDKLGWNVRGFDIPRLVANGAPVHGRVYDGMDAFHFLEPSWPMGLKYVATFYCPDMPAWKLMSNSEPEWYNAADSDVALRCLLAIRKNLEKEGRWRIFERHFVDLSLELQKVSEYGVNVDRELRRIAREDFQQREATIIKDLQPLIPLPVRPKGVYKNPEERLRKEGQWVEGKMVQVIQSLTAAELSALKKKQQKAIEKAQKAAEKAAAKVRKQKEKARLSLLKAEEKRKKKEAAASAKAQRKLSISSSGLKGKGTKSSLPKGS
jgi:uracil-DNA glycosylase family 4